MTPHKDHRITPVHFVKYHGTGNDYIYIDLNRPENDFFLPHILNKNSHFIERFIRQMSLPKFGVGSDGVVFIGPPLPPLTPPMNQADSQMFMFNLDGSRSGMCGNGLRCVAAYTFRHILQRQHQKQGRGDKTSIDMGEISAENNVRHEIRVMTDSGIKVCHVVVADDRDDGELALFNCGQNHDGEDEPSLHCERLIIAASLGQARFAKESIPVMLHSETPYAGRRAFAKHVFAKCVADRMQMQEFVARDDLPLVTGAVDLHDIDTFDGSNIRHQSLNRFISFATLSMGNPHCVVFVDNVDEYDVHTAGSLLEGYTRLWPERTNVLFVQIVDDAAEGPPVFKTRPFERGSGETLSCGSGACAVGVTVSLLGLVHPNEANSRSTVDVRVQMPGGMLVVRYNFATSEVVLIGEAVEVFSGQVMWRIPANAS